MTGELPGSDRTRVRRQSARASTDRANLYAILDSGLVCHVGVLLESTPAFFPNRIRA